MSATLDGRGNSSAPDAFMQIFMEGVGSNSKVVEHFLGKPWFNHWPY